mmetsp:Transcript_13465/g.31111  ORF Transcript_13465/g.31111 Transcript_13465/m.31111 type:complete len:280 (-) Transcript_13465:348-1187(-)
MTGTSTALSVAALLWIATSASVAATESLSPMETGFWEEPIEASPLLLEVQKQQQLRGGKSNNNGNNNGNNSNNNHNLGFPPIPPIHPRHTGSVQYSSVLDENNVVTYRRDIHAPCDYGMLVFNVGPSRDDLPYDYDLYGDAYLWSDNGGLCILYPTYTGYQVSTTGPFWSPGYDPSAVRFGDLTPGVDHMHRISSRILVPPGDAGRNHQRTIDRKRAGDYVIMAHHDFYDINYYKVLKDYVNKWKTGDDTADDNDNSGWVVTDLAGATSGGATSVSGGR